ncbi:MAG: hypothetical protein L6V95_09045 [Candidatus Melainabacteria bacterium]|nr:MAG: hypothetical protein L6V95_09045 [Candidatus Melainabacteria bacterium]
MFQFYENDCEITIEINPNDINEEYLSELKRQKSIESALECKVLMITFLKL